MSTHTNYFFCRTPGCGERHVFNLYVFAHWDEQLKHRCKCGALSTIQQGIVRVSKPGRVKPTNLNALNGTKGNSHE